MQGVQHAVIQADAPKSVAGQHQPRKSRQFLVDSRESPGMPDQVLRNGPLMPVDTDEFRIGSDAGDVLQIGEHPLQHLLVGKFGHAG